MSVVKAVRIESRVLALHAVAVVGLVVYALALGEPRV